MDGERHGFRCCMACNVSDRCPKNERMSLQLIWNTSGEQWCPSAYLNYAMFVQSPCSISVTLLHRGYPVEQMCSAGAICEKGVLAISNSMSLQGSSPGCTISSACAWHTPLSVRGRTPELAGKMADRVLRDTLRAGRTLCITGRTSF